MPGTKSLLAIVTWEGLNAWLNLSYSNMGGA